jgi:hypothetical protein
MDGSCPGRLGVLVGVGLTMLTGWRGVDPLVGIAMALNILWLGYSLHSHDKIARPLFGDFARLNSTSSGV